LFSGVENSRLKKEIKLGPTAAEACGAAKAPSIDDVVAYNWSIYEVLTGYKMKIYLNMLAFQQKCNHSPSNACVPLKRNAVTQESRTRQKNIMPKNRRTRNDNLSACCQKPNRSDREKKHPTFSRREGKRDI
jgi:hypothetical protein